MTAKFWSYLGFGRAWSQAPEAPPSTPMEELDVGRLTECSICTERMSNPKFLPCHHTFCCQCIERLCQSQSRRSVPCPLCRSPFNAPSSGDTGRLPTNVYVEELMRVGAMAQEANKAKGDLAAVKTKLKASEDGRQKAVEETRRQNTELAETRRRLAKVKDFSSHMDQLKKKLSPAQLYEFSMVEREKDTSEQLKTMESLYETASSEAKSCRQAKMEAEASLATATESCNRLSQQIRESKEETETLVNQLMTELEQSKDVIKNLSGQVEKKQGPHVFLVMVVIIFMIYVVNYKRESATQMSAYSIQNEQLRTETSECLTALKALRKQLENAKYKDEKLATELSDRPSSTTVQRWWREQPKDASYEKEELATTASESSTHVDLPKAIVITIIVILVLAAMKDLNIATPLRLLRGVLRFVLRE